MASPVKWRGNTQRPGAVEQSRPRRPIAETELSVSDGVRFFLSRGGKVSYPNGRLLSERTFDGGAGGPNAAGPCECYRWAPQLWSPRPAKLSSE